MAVLPSLLSLHERWSFKFLSGISVEQNLSFLLFKKTFTKLVFLRVISKHKTICSKIISIWSCNPHSKYGMSKKKIIIAFDLLYACIFNIEVLVCMPFISCVNKKKFNKNYRVVRAIYYYSFHYYYFYYYNNNCVELYMLLR